MKSKIAATFVGLYFLALAITFIFSYITCQNGEGICDLITPMIIFGLPWIALIGGNIFAVSYSFGLVGIFLVSLSILINVLVLYGIALGITQVVNSNNHIKSTPIR